MAEKLGVTASFLSAVENGKKKMPSPWMNKICDLYLLNEKQKEEFTTAIAETEEAIELNLSGNSIARREVAISFARSFPEMNDSQIEEIRKILLTGDK